MPIGLVAGCALPKRPIFSRFFSLALASTSSEARARLRAPQQHYKRQQRGICVIHPHTRVLLPNCVGVARAFSTAWLGALARPMHHPQRKKAVKVELLLLAEPAHQPPECKASLRRIPSSARHRSQRLDMHCVAFVVVRACSVCAQPNRTHQTGTSVLRGKGGRLSEILPHTHTHRHTRASLVPFRPWAPHDVQDLKEGFSLFDKKGDSKIAAKVSSRPSWDNANSPLALV